MFLIPHSPDRVEMQQGDDVISDNRNVEKRASNADEQ